MIMMAHQQKKEQCMTAVVGSDSPEEGNESVKKRKAQLKDDNEDDKKDDEGSATSVDKQSFPEKLMYLLDNAVDPNAFWWNKDGLSFGMDCSKKFCDNINEVFPGKIKLESFIRKLNRGFRRVTSTEDSATSRETAHYKCPNFQKDRPELMKNMKYQPGGTRPRKKPRSLEETRFSLDSKKSQTGILTNQASCASGGLHLAGAAGSNSSSLLEAARRRVDFREVAAAAANSPLQSLMDLQLQQAILQQRFGHFPATNVLHQQQRLMNPSVLRSLALTQSNLGGSSNNLANSLSRMNPTLLSDRLMGNLAATNTFPTTTSRLGTGTAGGEGANTQLGSGLMTYLLQQEQAGLQPDPRIVEFLLEKDRGV